MLCLLIVGCTDVSLYKRGVDNTAPDRLAVTGRVCTDDPKDKGFPVRVVFLVDTALGPVYTFDSERLRLKALRDSLAIHGGNDAFSFAVIGFAGRARLLAPEEGYFTRNPGELENAVAMLDLPQECVAEKCRDYSTALELTESVIEGDLTQLTPGERSRTQYAIVLMAAGPPDPLNCSYDCCDCDDDACDCENCELSMDCTQTTLREEVTALRDKVESQGASSFSFHVMHLAASDNREAEAEQLNTLEAMLQEMAFVGAGRFERFNSPDGITLQRIGLTRLSALFEAKSLLVTNMSVLPNRKPGDRQNVSVPVVDSDGDGLGDKVERQLGTNPLVKDSDGDQIGDFVETLISHNPTQPEENLPICAELGDPPYTDEDRDHLNSCEELLVGTEPTLPDTDGDGLIDWVELVLGTDYLRPDTLSDSDGDGAVNGEEAINHTDPRSSDMALHLGNAYRYDVSDEGIVSEPTISKPQRIQGVTMLSAGEHTTGGVGTLRYLTNPPRLSWQDAADAMPGKAVRVSQGGQFTLESSQDDPDLPERWISVEVHPDFLPPTAQEEALLAQLAERHCLSFTVRNIRLAETLNPEPRGGLNDVFIYFAEAPKGRLTLPGLFRVAHIPVTYHDGSGRTPSDVVLELSDEEFSSIGY